MRWHVRVQGDGLLAAGSHLEELAWLARDRLVDCARVPAGLRDPALREGVRVLADLAGDLLEVLADDLDLLATKVRAGATVYDHVEASVVRRVRSMNGSEALPYPSDEPAVVSGAAARCTRLAAVAVQVVDDLVVDAGQLAEAWQGPAARGCRAELRSATALVRSLVEPLHRSAAHLRAHADVVAEARASVDALRREYDALVADHRRETSRLLQDSELVGPLRRLVADDVRSTQQAELAAVHRRHLEVLDRVAAHARLTARLVTGAAGTVLPGRSGTAAHRSTAREGDLAALLPLLAAARRAAGVGSSPPPPGTPPDLVRLWWAALTSDEQQRAVRGWPIAVGALGGLPAAVRSAANERRLERDIAMLLARSSLSDDEQRWLDSCLLVRAQLARVRATRDPDGLGPTTAQLLVFDPKAYGSEGRVALAVGDVDTADNVAFLVPGMGSDGPRRAGRPDRQRPAGHRCCAARPRRAPRRPRWPGWATTHPGWREATLGHAADDGADLLVADLLAVQAARDVAPHLTVIGHSYGSTTAGTALRDRETGTDDVVLVGSPGPGVERAKQLHLPAGHVFVGASSRDPVSYLDRFGKDPAHASFGATRFRAEDPTRNSWRVDVDDHSKYFDAGLRVAGQHRRRGDGRLRGRRAGGLPWRGVPAARWHQQRPGGKP